MQTEVDRTNETLGSSSNGGVMRHRDCGLLKRAKFSKAHGRIDPSGDGGLHETLNELAH
ncbi:hypothetical protein ACRAWG_06175 [Methylobacterium sp. P31]